MIVFVPLCWVAEPLLPCSLFVFEVLFVVVVIIVAAESSKTTTAGAFVKLVLFTVLVIELKLEL